MIFSLFKNVNDGLLTGKEAVILLLFIMLGIVMSLTVHEFAHAFTAYKFGDMTPKVMGRVSLNPFKHIEPIGFLCFMVIGIGWAKPVPTNPLQYKKFKTGIAWVSISGVLANYILMVISCLFYVMIISWIGVINNFTVYLMLFFEYLILINSFLIVFNLIPLYPLDGFNFISSFLKPDNKFIRFNYEKGYKLFFIILMVCLFIEILTGIDFISLFLQKVSYWLYYPWITLFGLF